MDKKLIRRQKGFLINPFRMAPPPGAPVYATWNPADKAASIVLSNGDKTATTSSGVSGLVRSTIGKSAGKWYWEFTTGAIGGLMGIANSSAGMTSYPGSDANGRGYFHNGNKYTGGAGSAYGAAYSPPPAGIIIGNALDMDAGTITFYKNGVSQGVAFSGLAGTWYAAIGFGGGGVTVYAYNFGASAFAYSPPAGFNAGLYT